MNGTNTIFFLIFLEFASCYVIILHILYIKSKLDTLSDRDRSDVQWIRDRLFC